ncbi:hypothetical protein KSP40_PGU014285 [Platanthera guangdongensis]|uniref:Pescadillo homolog n=1 Tax=Platanthera guangdongensis TaxID=2320717 RepID=A0ABR2N5S9_9ASPA
MPKHYRPPGKKKEGAAARFITRSKAVNNLQVSLPLFRRLCILKGVFPRVPKKKLEGNQKTYYHVKDINFLLHEPLLGKFRDIKAYAKKIKKAKAKKNKELAERLINRQPSYKLDRLILERYPTFVDALRDLDDCLTMVHLFATLPAIEGEHIQVDRIHNCRRLSHEWQAYIARTHCLRKTFISVKGIYYQAELEGQKITWLTPHALQQVLTEDVDFNVMNTFLEFYEALLSFVNFKLYHSINVKYPPILDPRLEALAAELYAFCRYIGAGSRALSDTSQAGISSGSEKTDKEKMNTETEESEVRLAQLQSQLPANEPGALMNMIDEVNGCDDADQDTKECKSLLKSLKIFLSREVPRESLLFIIPAFGGVVSWEGDGAPFKETDENITHQIVDRPSIGRKFLSREYIQPQWVYDCINARILLPTEQYLVGRVPPPHLSPFVDNEAEGYVPEYAETIKNLQAAARDTFYPYRVLMLRIHLIHSFFWLKALMIVPKPTKLLSRRRSCYCFRSSTIMNWRWSLRGSSSLLQYLEKIRRFLLEMVMPRLVRGRSWIRLLRTNSLFPKLRCPAKREGSWKQYRSARKGNGARLNGSWKGGKMQKQ